MPADPLTLSLETVIAASPLLGHRLEDRSGIRDRQEPALVDAFRAASRIPFSNPEQQELFLVAPLDILVVKTDGGKQFHITETNGTGIGGLTTVPLDIVATILGGLTEMAARLPEPNPLVLVAVSGVALTEKDIASRRPDYQDYIRRTSAFIPARPKHGG